MSHARLRKSYFVWIFLVFSGSLFAQEKTEPIEIITYDKVPISENKNINSDSSVSGAAVAQAPITGNLMSGLYDETAGTQRQEINNSKGEYIDPFTGSVNLNHTDLVIPGAGGFDLAFTRYYSSNNVYLDGYSTTPQSDDPTPRTLKPQSHLGIGWDMHFGRVKRNRNTACSQNPGSSAADNPILELPNGSQKQLIENNTLPNRSNAVYATSDFWSAYCIANSNGIRIVSPDGVRYTMDYRALVNGSYIWYVTNIRDRNNNYMNISYSTTTTGVVRLNRIATSDSRIATFTYYTGNNASKLRYITAGSRRIEYKYNSNWKFLTSVIHGASRAQYFSYNTNNLLSRATRQAGGYTTYFYKLQCKVLITGCGRVVRPITNNTISSVVVLKRWMVDQKVEYDINGQTATWLFRYSTGDYRDYTTVTFPGGKYVYTHFGGDGEKVSSTPLEYRFTTLGYYGRLLSKETYSGTRLIQNEVYAYQNVKLSSQANTRFPLSFAYNYKESGVFFTRLTRKTKNRGGKNYITDYLKFNNNQYPHEIREYGEVNKVTTLTYKDISSALGNGYSKLVYIKEDEKLGNTTNRIINRTLDGRGNITYINEYGVRTDYTYHATGDMASRTDAMRNKTTFSNYYRGVARLEKHPEFVTIRRTVDYNGRISSETDGRNNLTGYSYDGAGRIRTITPPAGSAVVFSWSKSGSKDVQTITRGSYQRRITYDGFGRPICDQKESIYVGMTYDRLGRISSRTYPNHSNCNASARESYAYDTLGRLNKTTQVDNAFDEYTYLSNNKVQYRDQNGNIYTNTYRSFGDPDVKLLMETSGPEGLSLKIKRNLLDQITQINHQGTHNYAYDNSYFVQREWHPQTGTIKYNRNALGQVSVKDVALRITGYSYDKLNRIKTINYPGSASDVTYTFDQNSNLSRLQSGVTDFSYVYDKNNNLTQETQKIEGATYIIKNTYTNLDHLSKITYPDNSSVSYYPDDLGRPTKALPYVTKATYHPNGLVSQLVYGNGRTSSFSLNNRQFPKRMTTNGGISDREYSLYDTAGNLRAIKDYLNPSNNRVMTYDGQQRLRTASGPWGTGSISYDALGNIKSKRIGSVNLGYIYSSKNQVAQMTGLPGFGATAVLSYDSYGNMASKKSSTFGWRYDYDDGSNLLRAYDKSNQLLRTFAYSGDNMRVSSKSPNEHRRYIHSYSGNLLSEIKVSGGKPTVHNYYLGSTLIAEKEINARSQFNILPILMNYYLEEDQ